MALKKVSKTIKFNRLYYNIYGKEPLYSRGKIPYQDEMVKQGLIEVRQLAGDVLVIKMLGAGKTLTSQLNLEENNE